MLYRLENEDMKIWIITNYNKLFSEQMMVEIDKRQ